jgi:hypothetical protein
MNHCPFCNAQAGFTVWAGFHVAEFSDIHSAMREGTVMQSKEEPQLLEFHLTCASCKRWIYTSGEHYIAREKRIGDRIRELNQKDKVKELDLVDLKRADKATLIAALKALGMGIQESVTREAQQLDDNKPAMTQFPNGDRDGLD